jgi:hypothetical protein
MRSRANLALMAVMALAACSSPKPSPDKAQSNVTDASAPVNSSHAMVFVAMMDTDKEAIEAKVDKLYARYRSSADLDGGESDLAPPGSYTDAFDSLLDQWMKAQPKGEIDSVLSEADWVCQCQDWPGTGFKFLEKRIQPIPGDQIEARLRFDLGDGQPRTARILFDREGREWKIADLFSPDVPKGIVAQMTSDLARWEKK